MASWESELLESELRWRRDRDTADRESGGEQQGEEAPDDRPQPLSRDELKALLSRKFRIRKEEKQA